MVIVYKIGDLLLSKTGRASVLFAMMAIVYGNVIDIINLVNAMVAAVEDYDRPTAGAASIFNVENLALVNYVLPIDLLIVQLTTLSAWFLLCGTVRFFKGWVPTLN